MSPPDSRTIAAVLRRGAGEGAARAAAAFADGVGGERSVELAYTTLDTPVGTAVLAATRKGLVRLGLPNEPVDHVLEELSGTVSPRILELPARLDEARRELDQYFEGRRDRFEVELDWRLVRPGFYTRVLRETAKVPYGATSTYAEVAARAGSPRAFRAAGSALGHNPIPVIVPCHRILRAGGEVGNYGGGPEMKEYLLRLEGALSEEN